MITYAQLKSIAAKNNCRIEVNPRYSKPYEYITIEDGKPVWKEHRTHLGFEIGVNNLYGRKGKSEWQWFWFETLGTPETFEEDSALLFNHRYSMVTGKYHKGIRELINACSYIRENA